MAMLRKTFFFLLCLLSVRLMAAEDNAVLFASGNEAYQRGDYQAAIDDYHQILTSGAYSPQVYYNQGAAFQMLGKSVDATVNYRRALMLNPTLLQARRNLETIQRNSGIPMPKFTWRDEVSSNIRPVYLLYTGTTLAWIGSFAFVAVFLKKKRRFRWFAVSLLILVTGKVLALVGYVSDPRFTEANVAMVTGDTPVAARSAPAESSSLIVQSVPGTDVNVLSNRGAWSYCQLPDHSTAWLPSQHLVPLAPPPESSSL